MSDNPAPTNDQNELTKRKRLVRTLGLLASFAALVVLAFALACRREDRSRPFASGGAYVQNVRPTSALIAVLSAEPKRLEVDAEAVSSDRLPQSVSAADPARTTRHALELAPLTPDTRYRYTVRERGGPVLTRASFRTAPLPHTRAIRIVAFGDSGRVKKERRHCPFGIGERPPDPGGAQGKIADAILARGVPDLVLLLGDIVYNRGERRRYHEAFFEPFRALIERAPTYAAIGNHDAKTERAAPLLEAFFLPTSNERPDGTERYYRFEYGDARLICLDTETSPLEPGSEQHRWLEAELRRNTPCRWTIVFLHRPPFNAGKHGDDERLKRSVVPLFSRYGVDLVLAGHDHNYQRLRPVAGVTYVIAGGGGNRLYSVEPSPRLAASAKAHSFIELRLDDRRLEGRAVSAAGEELDRFRLE